ncbi:MAG: PrsW family intramembrane metalloprotease [Acidobacteria bacterium]|nr:PrsW family intramembrane metalloprotease [Acidobacteriota bacterium]MBI3427328.1 PrsW family intramembrane metalloprotease [Acidobacteriota bacterium]
MLLHLTVQAGSAAGVRRSLEQTANARLTLGRSAECAWQFDAPMVSGQHAFVHAEDDGFYLTDQNSTNGTLVNGVRIQRVHLRASDVIQLGYNGPQLRVELERTQAAPAPFDAFATVPAPPQAPPLAPAPPSAFANVGLYDPDKDAGKAPRSIGLGCAALFGGLLAFLVLVLTVSSLGIIPSFIGALTAFIPAVAYLLIFLWLDRYDPEPFAPLAFAFAWGSLFAIFVSGIFNSVFGSAAISALGSSTGDTLTGIISAPFIEEATKGLGVLVIWAVFRKDFDSVVDGIVYAGVVALGFAAVENVDYYGRAFTEGSFAGLFSTFILRGVLSPFSHVLFTSMTGIGCGIARETHNAAVKWFAPLAGYLGAMFLHALWNTLASFSSQVFFTGYFIFQMPLFLAFMGLLVYLVRREGRILRMTLATEVQRGLITQQQLDTVVSVFRRSGWVWSSLGNATQMNARRQFLRAVAKLGLCYWHVDRAVAAQSQTTSFTLIPKLQAEVFGLRDQI